MGKSKKGGSSSHHSGDKRKREPTPPSEDFGDSEYSLGVLLRVRGIVGPCLSPASYDDSDDSQGIAAEVWTYIWAVERAGLEGSDEWEVSSDEGNSSNSSEEESDGDNDGEGDGDDGGDGDGDGDGSKGDRGSGGGKGGSGSDKANG
jgi:hypothetical protein